eukprot:2195438-Rhodomonas_salina.11
MAHKRQTTKYRARTKTMAASCLAPCCHSHRTIQRPPTLAPATPNRTSHASTPRLALLSH